MWFNEKKRKSSVFTDSVLKVKEDECLRGSVKVKRGIWELLDIMQEHDLKLTLEEQLLLHAMNFNIYVL